MDCDDESAEQARYQGIRALRTAVGGDWRCPGDLG